MQNKKQRRQELGAIVNAFHSISEQSVAALPNGTGEPRQLVERHMPIPFNVGETLGASS